jgi:hypothetical protein
MMCIAIAPIIPSFVEQVIALQMLDDLESQQLEVVKVGTCRFAISSNPDWYSRLCESYKRRRRRYPRPRTIIKRSRVIKVLSQVANGCVTAAIYYERLKPFIEEIWDERESGSKSCLEDCKS